MGGQHHAQGGAAVPDDVGLVERAVDGVLERIKQVALDAHHDGLRFRVAHAAVVLQRLDGPVGVIAGRDHQAGVQEAGVGDAVARHALHGRQDDFAHDAVVQLGRDDRGGRIGAHAAGVGTGVAVLQALVVLAGGQGEHMAAVAHDDEAGFFAGEEFLDHHARAGLAQRAVAQHGVDRAMRFVQRHGDHHALAGSQAVGLDHDGRAVLVDIGVRLGRIGEGFVARRGDGMADHEGLGVILRAFQLRGRLGRTEDLQAAGAEHVDHAGGQGRLGADHGQRHALALDEVGQFLGAGQRYVLELLALRGAAVAGRHVDLVDARGAGQTPCEGVFAAARADYQEFHVAGFLKVATHARGEGAALARQGRETGGMAARTVIALRRTRRWCRPPARRPGFPGRRAASAS
ncbi:Uncharacterised protein [Bordetella pertussis]|nr:Uncharacterised protein [Bordetella pertussis]